MLGKDLSNTLFYQAHNHLRYKLMKSVSLWGPLEIVKKANTISICLSLSLTSQKKTAQDNQFYKLIRSGPHPPPANNVSLKFYKLVKKECFQIVFKNITKFLLRKHKRVLFLFFSEKTHFLKRRFWTWFLAPTLPPPLPSPHPIKQIANKRCMLDILSAFPFPDNTLLK